MVVQKNSCDVDPLAAGGLRKCVHAHEESLVLWQHSSVNLQTEAVEK